MTLDLQKLYYENNEFRNSFTFNRLVSYIFENLIEEKDFRKINTIIDNDYLNIFLEKLIKKHNLERQLFLETAKMHNYNKIDLVKSLEFQIKSFLIINPYYNKLYKNNKKNSIEEHSFIFSKFFPIVSNVFFQKQKGSIDFLIDFYNYNVPLLNKEKNYINFVFLIDLIENLNDLEKNDREYFLTNIQKFEFLNEYKKTSFTMEIVIDKLNSNNTNIKDKFENKVLTNKRTINKSNFTVNTLHIFDEIEMKDIINSLINLKPENEEKFNSYKEFLETQLLLCKTSYYTLKFKDSIHVFEKMNKEYLMNGNNIKTLRLIEFLINYITTEGENSPFKNNKLLERVLKIFENENLETFGFEKLLIDNKTTIGNITKYSNKLKLEDFDETNKPPISFLNNFPTKTILPYLQNKNLNSIIKDLEKNGFWSIKEENKISVKKTISVKKMKF